MSHAQIHLNAPPPNPFRQRIVSLAFSVGVALGSGLGYGFSNIAFHSHTTPPTNKSQTLTRAEYERIQPGMTLTETEAILGRGIETSRTETTATFVWKNTDTSYITAIFERESLIQKKQEGL